MSLMLARHGSWCSCQTAFAEVIDFDTDATESIVYLVPRIKNLQEGTASNMCAREDDRIKAIKVPYHFNFHLLTRLKMRKEMSFLILF